jgi:ATP phosphoribosyltransferase
MQKIVFAVPKGRILEELLPILEKSGIIPEEEFYTDNSRKLIFETSIKDLQIIKVRSFDVATFVAFGAAHIGVAGNDVLLEFGYDNIYSPLDLGVGKCRLSVAAPSIFLSDPEFWNKSHIKVATKYVNFTEDYFSKKGIQAECIKLNGSLELAPQLGLCQRIVDLVSTGNTLKANEMVEGEKLADVTSRLVVNKQAYKANKSKLNEIIKIIENAIL